MKKLAWILLIVGALNWGLVGLGMLLGGANWNIVSLVFGGVPVVESLVYVLVGISAIVHLFAKGHKNGSCNC
jgi:uncharacterized membrane protein YuzA (DUF378 family)